jgi:hypothetical protein
MINMMTPGLDSSQVARPLTGNGNPAPINPLAGAQNPNQITPSPINPNLFSNAAQISSLNPNSTYNTEMTPQAAPENVATRITPYSTFSTTI